ncbi:MAG: protein kinase [Myxococcales bacterium]|nr:protein kinase [Myxococcales bacterium]
MGMNFGKYVLEKQLAIGGMAEIFIAEQHGPAGFAKTLCIKRILQTYANDSTFIEMFLDEARTAAKLSHPNIVQIFELGEIDGSYYIAMEYIKGASLSKIIRKLKENGLNLPLHYAAKIIANVCAGLDYAHSFVDPGTGEPLHLVHRDISPDNILVSFTGAVKMIDFGIAKAVTNTSQTQAGAVKGKFSYMSPEQVMGRPLDGRSDLFSLGIVLYELTTLRKPFGDDADLMTVSAIVHDPPQEPRKVIAEYPPQLEELLMHALEKDRNQRFVSAQEMQHMLERFIHEQGEFLSDRDIGNYVARLFSGSTEDIETLRNLGSGVRMKLTGMPRVAPDDELANRQVEIAGQIRSTLVAGETDALPSTAGADAAVATRTPVKTAHPSVDEIPDNKQPKSLIAAKTDAFPARVPKSTAGSSDQDTDSPKSSSKSGIGLWFVFVVVLALLGGGGYYLWTQYWQEPTTTGSKSSLNGHSEKGQTKTVQQGGVVVPDTSSTTAVNQDQRDTVVPEKEPDVSPTSTHTADIERTQEDKGDVTTPTQITTTDTTTAQDKTSDGSTTTSTAAADIQAEKDMSQGTVQVTTTPPMKVYDGDNFKGNTPITYSSPAGRRMLKLFAPDGTKVTREVQVTAGGATTVEVKLTEGKIKFAGIEPGVEVTVDNRRIGKTPIPDHTAWQGNHEVTLVHPSGKIRTIPVIITETNREHKITVQW